MAHERLHPTFQFDEERLNQLRQIAPEAFADGKINWETLRASLGEHLEEESTDTEHFGLFWPGKRQARRIASLPSTGTLVPVYGEGLKADGTPDTDGHNDSQNIFIEGENLEVLKLLQKSYAGRIKMIYIDPPYNTGNDFIYDDDFTEPLQEYLRRTGQVDEEGKSLTTNKRADGRFHSKWLSMMYPRLRLAKNLLKEDGIIFMSIDDNELSNLLQISNELFGEENREGIITWRRRHNQPNDKTKVIGKVAEYILVYSKNRETLTIQGTFFGVPLSEKRMNEYKNQDNDPNGPWTSNPWKAAKGRGGSKYEIETPTGVKYNETWYGNKDTFLDLLNRGRVHWTDNGQGYPRIKIYLDEAIQSGQSAINFFTHELYGSNQEGSNELSSLFNNLLVFDNPKPTKLLSTFINIGAGDDDIILDFFAGAGSTAHALINLEEVSRKNRKFILVQLPESVNEKEESGANAIKIGLSKISDIAKERIRRVIKSKKLVGSEISRFKVFQLTNSHFKPWQNYHGQNPSEVEDLFSQFEDPLKEDWTEEGLTTEVLLTEGFPLDSRIEIDPVYGANRLRRISSDFHEYSLLVCLDSKINTDTITQLDLGSNDVFICLDRAITDQEKLRLSDKGLLKTI